MKALICLNGTPPSEKLALSCVQGSYIIAADGACNYLQSYGMRANCIIGDFDSFALRQAASVLKHGGIINRHECEKDYTDGQLALKAAIEGGYSQIVFLGALGGRADHELENFRLLYEFSSSERDLSIVCDEVKIYLIKGKRVINGQSGCTVSLLPYTDTAVIEHSTSLKYPTEQLVLSRLESLSHSGISNVMLDSTAHISVSNGAVLAFVYEYSK